MKNKEFTKEFTLTNPHAEGRVLTLVTVVEPRSIGQLNPKKKEFEIVEDGTRLSVGWALKNPTDNESPKSLGLLIARGRREKNPLLTLTLRNSRITDRFVNTVMAELAKEVDDRFYSFIPLGSNGKKQKEIVKGDEINTSKT